MDEETKQKQRTLQDEALGILEDITAIFPPDYRFTLVARHTRLSQEMDIVLTDDNIDDAIDALRANKQMMEIAQ